MSSGRIIQLFPPAPAPSVVPGHCPDLYNATFESLRSYLYTYIYIWLTPYNSFWMYPTNITTYYISGYTWQNNYWEYSQFHWRDIDSFY